MCASPRTRLRPSRELISSATRSAVHDGSSNVPLIEYKEGGQGYRRPPSKYLEDSARPGRKCASHRARAILTGRVASVVEFVASWTLAVHPGLLMFQNELSRSTIPLKLSRPVTRSP